VDVTDIAQVRTHAARDTAGGSPATGRSGREQDRRARCSAEGNAGRRADQVRRRTIEVGVTTVRDDPGRIMTPAITYSRRHVDLGRVAAALCPGYEITVIRRTVAPGTAFRTPLPDCS
jgi:hypothetical protein